MDTATLDAVCLHLHFTMLTGSTDDYTLFGCEDCAELWAE